MGSIDVLTRAAMQRVGFGWQQQAWCSEGTTKQSLRFR